MTFQIEKAEARCAGGEKATNNCQLYTQTRRNKEIFKPKKKGERESEHFFPVNYIMFCHFLKYI